MASVRDGKVSQHMAKLSHGCPWDAWVLALGYADRSATVAGLEDVVDAPGLAHKRDTWDCQKLGAGGRMDMAQSRTAVPLGWHDQSG